METTNNMAASSVEGRAARVRMGPVAFSGFPVRSLTRQQDGTNGEWITAYQADQKTRLKVVLSTSMRGGIESGRTIRPPTNTREVSGAPRKMLDGVFLLKHCYVEEPGDLCVCNISGEGLKVYKPEDFALFDNVVYVNAADNELPLEAFATFPILQDLELTLNSVVDVSFKPGEFVKLQNLDLSYNSLSGMALLALGTLPSLKELHLTGNNIVALPAEMSRPFPASKLSTEGTLFQIRFPALERLWLDDNKLVDQSTFATLAGLRRLRYLNLDNNEIYTIPQLKLIGTSPLKPTTDKHTSAQDTPLTHAATQENSNESAISTDTRTPSGSSKSHVSEHVATSDMKVSTVYPAQRAIRTDSSPPIQAPPNTAQMASKPLSRHLLQSKLHKPQRVQTCGEPTPTLTTVDPPDQLPGPPGRLPPPHSIAPFPQLETLSLANNLILTAEGLIACGSWSSLTELIVHGNPLTRTARGMPPLLQTHLVEHNGISVVRHKPSPRKRHTIGKAAKDFKKVSSAPPPPIPKHPLPFPALEAPPDVLMLEYPSPSSSAPFPSSPSQSSPSHSSPSNSFATESPHGGGGEEEGRGKEREGNGNVVKDQQGVFMTQGAGEDQEGSYPKQRRGQTPLSASEVEKLWSVKESYKEKRKELKQAYRHVHDRYKGYEALLDTYEDPSMPIPTDPNGCTRALQYALKHPLVVPDTGVPSHRPVNTGDYLKRKPSATTSLHKPYTSSKVRDLQCILDDIRTRCVALETNLGTALQPQTPPEKKSIGKLQKESQQLLAEMQARYDRVRASSLGILKSVSEFGDSSDTTPSRSRRHSSDLLPVASRENTRNSSPKLS